MKLTIQKETMLSLAWALLAVYAVALMPAAAMAADVAPISSVLCKVVGWFTGSVGGGIATLAIIVIGIGALMGKVSWGMAIIVGLGIGVIFGAGDIMLALGGTNKCS